jgi:DNA polymerase III subunit alpha, Gram-positive type
VRRGILGGGEVSKYVFVDLETSGTVPGHHEIIEIGMVTDDGAEFECSLDFDIDKASPKALEVNGWGQREFAPKINIFEAKTAVQNFWMDLLPVVNNPGFDISFLRAWLCPEDIACSYTAVDLKSLVAGKLGIAPPLQTSQVVKHFGIGNPAKHTALGDARWNMHLFLALHLWETK